MTHREEESRSFGPWAAVKRALGENRYDAERIRYDRVTLQHEGDELVIRSHESGDVLERIDLEEVSDPGTLARSVYTVNAVEVRD